MKNKNIKGAKISVDCVPNDPVDIRCGGPEYLGFDFFVREEETEILKEFISITLNNFEIPITNIYVSNFLDLSPNEVWNKERIVECIKKEVDYLKHEASRNYKPIRKR